MLEITIEAGESWDEAKNEFVVSRESLTIQLEHSLASLSKWEQRWKIPFLGDAPRTDEQTLDYIKCMTLTPDVPSEVYEIMSDAQIQQISDYITDKRTATWFNDVQTPKNKRGEVVTAEIIYHWMIALTIPFECQYWHLNTLLTLVKVCNEKNSAHTQKPKRFGKDAAAQRRELNAKRKEQMKTTG